MELKGQLEEFIYQNEMNGYSIGILDTEEEKVTVVGYLPFINKGDTLKLFGKYVIHQEYGRQFKIDTFEKVLPETLEGLEKYLASGIVKGVGPSTAKKIVETFQDSTLAVLKQEPEKLSQIKGISHEKAISIAEEFNEKWELWQIVGFLERFGISTANCKKVYDALGKDAIEKIEADPYLLIDITYGVDFKRIDKMAMEIGIDSMSPKRIESAIKYALNLAGNNGHTCVLQENLKRFVQDLLHLPEEPIQNAMINLKAKKQIMVLEKEESKWIYLYPCYQAEENIAVHLCALLKSKNTKKVKNIQKELHKQEVQFQIELSEKQKEAIEMVNEHNVCLITGGPGTGKTTIIKNIIQLYQTQKMKVVLCAPTGRAAKRMTEATGEEAKTIHRLLEIGKIEEEKNFMVDYDVAPIDADVIIIDEMSMVDTYIMNYVMKAIYLGTKLVLVGDENQLPSVGPGKVLKDMIESGRIPTVCLNKIFRQAAKSQIIVNAHQVNQGLPFIEKKEMESDHQEDFFWIHESVPERMLYHVLSLSKDRLAQYGDYEFYRNIQVLSPTKKGMMGTRELNQQLQSLLNPPENGKKEKKYGEIVFREGDKVMQIKNNYDIIWEKNGDHYETGSGIFNGEMGILKKIDEESKQVKIVFDDDKIVWYTFNELDQIEHSYCITIHKSQGSEFDVAILVVPNTYAMLLNRNLLYTGITRAKKMLVLIGWQDTIQHMIQNTNIKQRNTGLAYLIQQVK